MTDFKNYLQFSSPENQIYEIDSMFHDSNKSNQKYENNYKKFRIINDLKTLKKEIILNHEEVCETFLN